ncbi:MAG: hypothetical protein FJ027_20305 [Candidatus Rokubacteria bacterium]|nr:hypothetical protein [Candidatus Rokubacteria bacterium]
MRAAERGVLRRRIRRRQPRLRARAQAVAQRGRELEEGRQRGLRAPRLV